MKQFFGKKSRSTLGLVLLVSLVAHLVGILVFGMIKIVSEVFRDETVFQGLPLEQTPQMEPEYTVNIKQRTRETPPARPPAIVVNNPAELDIPALDIDVNIDSSAVVGRSGGNFSGGLAGVRDMAMNVNFLGTEVKGNLAVIMDISGSIDAKIFELVIGEVNRNFSSAKKIGVQGSCFTDDNVLGNALKPFKTTPFWSGRGRERADYKLIAEGNGYAYVHPQSGGRVTARRRDGTLFFLQSHGKALELLLNSRDCPGTVIIFSDFMDRHDQDYMNQIQELVKQNKVKVVFWNPFPSWQAARSRYEQNYIAFAQATGGEVKTGSLKP